MNKVVAAALTAALFSAGSVNAGSIEIDIVQLNGEVLVGYGGTFDTSGAAPLSVAPTPGLLPSDATISSVDGQTILDFYFGSGFIAPFGSGAATEGGVVSGDVFAISSSAIGFENGYVSGSAFSGSLTFRGTSLSALGIDLFSNRTFEVGSNTIVLNSSVSTVPLPSALVLMLSALAGLGVLSRTRSV